MWSLSDCNWTWMQNYLVHKWTLKWLNVCVHLQTKWFEFESSCSHFTIKSSPHTCFSTLNLRGYSFLMYKHVCFHGLQKSLTMINSSFVSTLFSLCIHSIGQIKVIQSQWLLHSFSIKSKTMWLSTACRTI